MHEVAAGESSRAGLVFSPGAAVAVDAPRELWMGYWKIETGGIISISYP